MVEEQQDVTMTSTVTGQPRPRITWSKSVDSLPEKRAVEKNGQLTLYNVTRKDGGVYLCKGENILGRLTNTVQLMIFSRLQFQFIPPKILTPILGSTVRLPCWAESDLRPTVAWKKNGQTSLPADSNVLVNGTLLIPKVKKSRERIYSCIARNLVTSIEATVRINSPIITSCTVIRIHVSSANGNYVIDPDGEGGLAPFTVYCDMSDMNGVGVTLISHDTEHWCMATNLQVAIHVTVTTLERVCLIWRVSPESRHTMNSLSNMSVIIQGY